MPIKFNPEQRIQRIQFRVQFEIYSKTVRPFIFSSSALFVVFFSKAVVLFFSVPLFVVRRFGEQRHLVGSCKKLVDELHVGDVVLLISDDAEEFAELGGFGVLELLAERAEDVLDLGERDLAGTLLVEDLQAFNVVLLDSGGGGVGLDGEGDSLLAQLGGA